MEPIWDDVSKILKRATKRSYGRMSVVDIHNNLVDETSQLWIVFNTETLKIIPVMRKKSAIRAVLLRSILTGRRFNYALQEREAEEVDACQ